MNITQKAFINIAIGLVIIGVALIALGAAFGGRIFTFGTGKPTDITNEYENVRELSVEVDAGKMIIRKGEKFEVRATDVYKSAFVCTMQDGILTVKNKAIRSVFGFGSIHLGFYPWMRPDSVITVYIPEDAVLVRSDLTIGAGKIEAYSLETDAVRIKVGAGEVKISDMKAQDADLDCGVGSIVITGEITGDSVVKCGVGSIRLDLKGDPKAYDYKIKVGLGSTQINDESYTGSTNKTETNDGATGSFNLDCGVGEIVLNIGE